MKKSIKTKVALITIISMSVFLAFSVMISYIFYSDAIVQGSVNKINTSTETQFFIIFTCAELIIGIVLMMIILAVVEACIVKPLNDLKEAVSVVAYDSENNVQEKLTSNDINLRLKNLDINSGDELEELYHSIQKMQMDVNDYIISVKEESWEAEHDNMTMLSNITKYERRKKDVYPFVESIYVGCFDIINMSVVNSRLSVNAGDSIISKVARELRRVSCDTIHTYRLHDDYFVMVLCGYSEEEAISIISRWVEKVGRLNRSTDTFDCRLVWGGSYGNHDFNFDDVYKRADAEMYCKKMIVKKEIGSVV